MLRFNRFAVIATGLPLKRDLIFIALICAAAVTVIAFWHSPVLLPSPDGDAYLMLGRSLAEGNGYRDIYLPDKPISTNYPLGWPAILSLVYRAWEYADFPYQMMIWLLFVLMGIAVYLFGRQLLGPWGSFCTAFCIIAHAVMAEFTQMPLTEIPFALFLYGGLLLWYAGERNNSFPSCCIALACFVFTSFLKFYGELVLPAVFFSLLIKRKWKLLAVFTLLVALKIAVQFGMQGTEWIHRGKAMRQPLVPDVVAQNNVSAAASGLFSLVLSNARRMLLTLIPHNVFPSLYHLHAMNKLKALACLFFSLWIGAGMLARMVKKDVLAPLVCAAILAGLLTRFDGPYIFRYYAPASPFFVLFGIVGVREALGFTRRHARAVRIAAIALDAISMFFIFDKTLFLASAHTAYAHSYDRAGLLQFERFCDCIAKTAPADALLMSPAAATVFIRTNRHTAWLPYHEAWEMNWNEGKLDSWVAAARDKASYIVLPAGWTIATGFPIADFEKHLAEKYPGPVRRLQYGLRSPNYIYSLDRYPSDTSFCTKMSFCLQNPPADKRNAVPPASVSCRECGDSAYYNPNP